MSSNDTAARLVIRPLAMEDLDAIQTLHQRCFPTLAPWRRDELESHLAIFPEGQIGVELDGVLVAISSSLIVHEEDYMKDHTFDQVTGKGMLTTHDPSGDSLYGIDIAVDPTVRGMRLARRMYDARKELVQELNLERMMIVGRLPNYHEHAHEMKAAEYVRRVFRAEIDDPVLNAQRANRFTVRRVINGYLPQDTASKGFGVLMEWLNPEFVPIELDLPSRVRVCSVQYQMRPIDSFDEFAQQCTFFLDTASDYRSDFVLFPELITNQLMSQVPSDSPGRVARRLSEFTEAYSEFFHRAALKYNVNIIAGSHLCVEDGTLYNIAFLFHRDGTISKQYKIHVTPSEAQWWGVTAGDAVNVFDTDCGKVAIMICYDIEFPELSRVAMAKGASIFFVPFNTDIRSGYLRVRSCAQARAIENHAYVVLSGAVGNLPEVDGSDIHYAQSAILTPSDIAFARDGVAAEATPNVETMLVHDLDMDLLRRTRRTGTVRTVFDRRRDLYSVVFKNKDEEFNA